MNILRYLLETTDDLKVGDPVIIKSRDGKATINVGRILRIQTDGNIEVKLDASTKNSQGSLVVEPKDLEKANKSYQAWKSKLSQSR